MITGDISSAPLATLDISRSKLVKLELSLLQYSGQVNYANSTRVSRGSSSALFTIVGDMT